MDRSSKQRISKDIVALNNALDQMDLTDIYRTFQPKEAYLSNAHGKFSDRPPDRTQNKPQEIQGNWNHFKHFHQPQGPETINQHQEKETKNTQTHGDWIAI